MWMCPMIPPPLLVVAWLGRGHVGVCRRPESRLPVEEGAPSAPHVKRMSQRFLTYCVQYEVLLWAK